MKHAKTLIESWAEKCNESKNSTINWVYPDEPGNSLDNTETFPAALDELIAWAENMSDASSLIKTLNAARKAYDAWLDATEEEDF